MRKAYVLLLVLLFLTQCFGEPTSQTTITVSGCILNTNGSFKLLTQGQTYILKGHQSALFSYNGKLTQVTGKVDATQTPSPGIPVVLHVTKLKKLADFCH